MLDIAAPPAPEMGGVISWACALGALAAGAGLILWGRRLHRYVLALAMAGVGALVAGSIAGWLKDIDATVVLVGTIAAFLVAGLLIAKAAWAFAFAALVCGPLLLVLAGAYQPPDGAPAHRPDDASFPAWARAAGHTVSDFTARATWARSDAYWTFPPPANIPWTSAAWKIQLLVALAALAVFVGALFLGQWPPLLTCALLGACCFLGGLAMALGRFWPGLWPWAWDHPLVMALATAALTAAGVMLQYRGMHQGKPTGGDTKQ
ncbi:MAG: hypothetical protein NTV86_09315 [Planctomycetota bacterium]|nr:hypothetical protein [Planctomycetota bacterium]